MRAVDQGSREIDRQKEILLDEISQPPGRLRQSRRHYAHVRRRVNPQRSLDQTASILKHELHRLLVDGIKYERRPGGGPDAAWEMLLFVKLPGWFAIDTPVGKYNPDWAILKHDGTALYLVRETKGTRDFLELRPQISERAMQRLVHRVFVHPKRLRNFGNGFFADPPPIENVPTRPVTFPAPRIVVVCGSSMI